MNNESKYNVCEIVSDLLPLYADGVCSEGSQALVEDHVKECPICRSSLDKMKSMTAEQTLKKEKSDAMKLHGKRRDGRTMKSILLAIVTAYIPIVFLYPLFTGNTGLAPTNYPFRLMVVLLYSLPFLTALISLGFTVSKVVNGGFKLSRLRVSEAIAAVSAIFTLLCCLDLDILIYPTLLYPALLFSAVSIAALTVTAVKNKKSGNTVPLHKNTFIFCFFTVFTVFLAIIITVTSIASANGKRPEKDEYEPIASHTEYIPTNG